jgi:hypothetical protein
VLHLRPEVDGCCPLRPEQIFLMRAQGTQVLLGGDYALVQSPEITRITPNGSVSTFNANTSSGNGIALDRGAFSM